ncbi:cyclase family protein [Alicyclobacillus cycloheptanicus]|uniref:Kynurenine formamidase n=1 Tax=Alicyclobacillus cycloheptanicus TaxID=1457 RepID=A0ABT9XI10_9BACL|nr:cyclase family protein [Alicyclobacillus cycloheptanicus]MDQ0189930.1 kynurenine formamidase [Alicyclobacillus cycloheptanicus]WDM02168.1 cyclase family protein [Alicyclobacillus cycloheptanicus]
MRKVFNGCTVIDLSVTVSDTLPSGWPTHMPFQAKVWNYYVPLNERQGHVRSEAPYQTRFWIIDEHCGTHFDAPTHFVAPADSGIPWAGELGSQTGEQVPLQDLMGPAVRIDVTHLANESVPAGESPWITAEHIKAWESRYGVIEPGTVVLLHTGWDRYYVPGPEGEKYAKRPLVHGEGKGWPAPDVSAVLHLYERGVKCLAIDAPSIGAAHDGAPVHQEGLSRGMRYVEMLTGLEKLPPRGAWFIFLPVKVEGSTGGPGRAIALLSEQ